jgi:hemerythrin-like domain-containing protein
MFNFFKKDKTISKEMHREHELIFKYFNQLGASMKKIDKNSIELFKKFEEVHDNHLAAEEKAIFTFVKDAKKRKTIQVILTEHTEMREIQKKIKSKIKLGLPIKDLHSDLKSKLINHIKFEEKDFYPWMDKDTTPAQKEKILKKVEYIFGTIERKHKVS